MVKNETRSRNCNCTVMAKCDPVRILVPPDRLPSVPIEPAFGKRFMDRSGSTPTATVLLTEDTPAAGWDPDAVWRQRVRRTRLADDGARIVVETGSAGWDPPRADQRPTPWPGDPLFAVWAHRLPAS